MADVSCGLHFSPNGRRLALLDGTGNVFVWDLHVSPPPTTRNTNAYDVRYASNTHTHIHTHTHTHILGGFVVVICLVHPPRPTYSEKIPKRPRT